MKPIRPIRPIRPIKVNPDSQNLDVDQMLILQQIHLDAILGLRGFLREDKDDDVNLSFMNAEY